MEKDLELRTKRFGLAVIKFTSSLPSTRELDVLARQLVRAATSIGANYREANRGVSRADFANKVGTVQKEAAETQYWLELLIESNLCPKQAAATLQEESSELLAIFTSIGKKLKQ
jgi:four helix bundle protein